MRSTRSTRTIAALGTSVALLALLATASGCSNSTDDAASREGGDVPATAPAEAPAADEALGGGLAGGEGGTSGPLTVGRALAITGTASLEATDVNLAVRQITDLVTLRGGAIFDAEVRLGEDDGTGPDAWARLVVKIPPNQLNATVSALSDIGRVTSLTQSAEDVTDQLVDLDLRIASMRASVARVAELLEEAEKVSDIVTIEAELTWRETELERLLAAQRNLENRVDAATLTIDVTTVDDLDGSETSDEGIVGALQDGWDAFVTVLRGIVIVLAYLAPFLLMGALGGMVAWKVRARRINRGHTTPTE